MADDPGPWKPRRPPRTSRLGLYLWLGLLAGVGLLIWYLQTLFPGAAQGDWAAVRIINLIGFLALVSSGLLFIRRVNLGETIRNLALWGMVIALIVVLYTVKQMVPGLGARIQSDLMPGTPLQTGAHELVLTAEDGGNFFVYGEVNGVRMRFMIDTGASDIVLSPADAARAGIDLDHLDFDQFYATANGVGAGAAVTLDRLRIGPIVETQVRASVNKTPMQTSLLGMAFLKSLKSFEVTKTRLVLRW